MLKLNLQGPQEIREYPQAAAGHLKNIGEKHFYKMLKLNPQGPQKIQKYPQAAAGHLKDFREFILTKYLEKTLRELQVVLQNLW